MTRHIRSICRIKNTTNCIEFGSPIAF